MGEHSFELTMSQGHNDFFQFGSQVQDETNYEFFLEWLPLFAADLPWHSEMKASQYRESNKLLHD